jgi:hypothetical protein
VSFDIAPPFELYVSSFAAHTVPIAANRTITTRHGLRLVATPTDATAPDVDRLIVPGAHTTDEVDPQLLKWAADRDLPAELVGGRADAEFSFDAMLRDLAAHTDRTTAQVTAKSIEYPADRLRLSGAPWPWRPTALFALTLTAAIGVSLLPAATRRSRP